MFPLRTPVAAHTNPNPQSWNRYAYVVNSPLDDTDSMGLWCSAPMGGGKWDSECNNANYGGGGGSGSGSGSAPSMWNAVYTLDFTYHEVTPPEQEEYPAGSGILLVIAPGDGYYTSYVEFLGYTLNTSAYYSSYYSGLRDASHYNIKTTSPYDKAAHCLGEALSKNGVSLLLDVAGFVPGEGAVKAVTQLSVGIVSTVNSAVHEDVQGSIMGIAGIHLSVLEPYAKEAGWSEASAIPVAGTLLNVVATGRDLAMAGKDFNQCMQKQD